MSSTAAAAAAPSDRGPGPTEATRRHLSSRQVRTVARLTEAVVAELRAVGYDGLSVRNVARRAGVAPATAYTYFTSREHLVTEVFWRRLEALPDRAPDRRRAPARRVADALSDMALLVADEPELAAACSVAMLANDPDVKLLRGRIGAAMHRRLVAALGEDADPAALRVLELATSGALIQAGGGHLAYADLPALLAEVADVVVGPR
ncbi:MAG TPA: helix-turn-helix domain-containing protein [Acidimicrobiales bacterium]|nr:helix-turn-helix domain-containing protein [Acidimicrobiales bacterium]